LLAAAGVPATVTNWAGDEVVTVQDWSAYFGELTGIMPTVIVREMPGTQRGLVMDSARRRSITGPCRVGWRDGMRRMYEARYPDGVPRASAVPGQASRLLSAYQPTEAPDPEG
jgi:hypothetical protein